MLKQWTLAHAGTAIFILKDFKPFEMLSQVHPNDAKEVSHKAILKWLHNFPAGIMPHWPWMKIEGL